MGVVSFSIPRELVLSFTQKHPIKYFVETGTFKGDSSIWAAQYFEKVYTIEIDETLHKNASTRSDAPKNITFVLGNSKDQLANIVREIDAPALYWLDGHWCMGAGGKDHECPLEDELKAIQPRQDSVILIDDARCFLGKLPPPHNAEDWPRIDDVFKLFFELFPQHQVTIIQDVIVAFPESMQQEVDKYWIEKFDDFYNERRKLEKISMYKLFKIKLLQLFSSK